MTSPEHAAHEQDVGAYLLGALSAEEAAAFERHARACHACADELERLGVAVEALPRSVPPLRPPPTLKRSLMRAVRDDPRAARVAGRWPRAGHRRLAGRALVRGRVPALAAGLAALALGIGIGAGLDELGGGDRDRQASKTLPARVQSPRLAGASGELVLDPRAPAALLRVRGVRQPPAGRVYQVWVQRGEQFRSAGLLAVRADGTGAAAVTASLRGARAVHVTRERRGGAPAPTEPPVLSVKIA